MRKKFPHIIVLKIFVIRIVINFFILDEKLNVSSIDQ